MCDGGPRGQRIPEGCLEVATTRECQFVMLTPRLVVAGVPGTRALTLQNQHVSNRDLGDYEMAFKDASVVSTGPLPSTTSARR
jgi:hypothetical protein